MQFRTLEEMAARNEVEDNSLVLLSSPFRSTNAKKAHSKKKVKDIRKREKEREKRNRKIPHFSKQRKRICYFAQCKKKKKGEILGFGNLPNLYKGIKPKKYTKI